MSAFVNEKSFSIHVVGDITGKTYTGDFIAYKFLPPRLQLLKDQILRRNLAGDNPLMSGQVELASRLAIIQSGLKEGPDWWKEADCRQGDDMLDRNVIDEVFESVNEIQTDAEKVVLDKAAQKAKDLPEAAKKAAEKDEAEQK